MEWKKAVREEGGSVKIPPRWLHLYYYEALNILFRFENALRVFVYVVLKNELGTNWDNASIGGANGGTIRSETKKRIAQSRDHGYLGYEVTSPMLYLNSGELIEIIVSEAYWKYFARYFKASKSIVQTKLQEIGTVRNSLAHFRPIKEDDLDLIKQNSKHVLVEIEDCLLKLVAILSPVPTNSEATWYKELKSIGGANSSTLLYVSPDQNWVRIECKYRPPTLVITPYGSDYFTFKILNLRVHKILKSFATVRDHCIYICENPVYALLGSDGTIDAPRSLSFVFSIKNIEANRSVIVENFREMVLQIEAETELIKSDHGAQGELVETFDGSGARQEANNQSFWTLNADGLRSSLQNIDDVEFWGARGHYAGDFICATTEYPWMPSSVSNFDWQP